MKINPNILFRFESKIKDGICLIFDMKDHKIYTGGEDEYKILKMIQQGKTIEEIHCLLKIGEIDVFIEDLMSKKIIGE